MSVGEVAGLIAACALLILVGLLAYPILKLGKVLDETRIMVKGVSDSSVPLLGEVTTTVATTNAQLAEGGHDHRQRDHGDDQRGGADVAVLGDRWRSAGEGGRVLVRRTQGARGPASARTSRRVREEMKAERRREASVKRIFWFVIGIAVGVWTGDPAEEEGTGADAGEHAESGGQAGQRGAALR